MDFDDTYQYSAAKYYGLQVVTMDKDFEKIKDVEILILISFVEFRYEL